MTSVEIPHTRITRDGILAPAGVLSDSADGFTIPANDGNIVLVIVNDSADDVSVEVEPQQTYGGLALANQPLEVAAGDTGYFGPWPPALFNDDRSAVQIVPVSGAATLFTLGI